MHRAPSENFTAADAPLPNLVLVVFLDNGHRDSANTHDIVKTQSDRLRAITGVYPSSAALRPQRLRREASAVTPGVGAVASRRSALIHREGAGRS